MSARPGLALMNANIALPLEPCPEPFLCFSELPLLMVAPRLLFESMMLFWTAETLGLAADDDDPLAIAGPDESVAPLAALLGRQRRAGGLNGGGCEEYGAQRQHQCLMHRSLLSIGFCPGLTDLFRLHLSIGRPGSEKVHVH